MSPRPSAIAAGEPTINAASVHLRDLAVIHDTPRHSGREKCPKKQKHGQDCANPHYGQQYNL
jgi:hypothetical protein